MKKIINKLNNLFIRTRLAAIGTREKLEETRGDFVLDHAMVFVIILVIGAIVIAVISNYIQNDFVNLIKEKITAFFN